MTTASSDPLSRLALRIPEQTARGASIAGRLFGAGLVMLVAFSESYDPTQVFASVVGLLIVASFVPLRNTAADASMAFGAGLVFFAGCVLTHLELGIGMLAMGGFAGLAGFAIAHRAGRGMLVPAVAFVAAVFVTGALQALIVFAFE